MMSALEAAVTNNERPSLAAVDMSFDVGSKGLIAPLSHSALMAAFVC